MTPGVRLLVVGGIGALVSIVALTVGELMGVFGGHKDTLTITAYVEWLHENIPIAFWSIIALLIVIIIGAGVLIWHFFATP